MQEQTKAIFDTEIASFEDILKKVKQQTDLVQRPDSCKMSLNSSKALIDLFESSLSPESVLGESRDSQEQESNMRRFNVLFREASNLQGLLRNTEIIGEYLQKKPSVAQTAYFKIREMIDNKKGEKAIRLCNDFIQDYEDFRIFSPTELIYATGIQYTLGCLYINRGLEEDQVKAQNLLKKYFKNSNRLAFIESSVLSMVQQSLHAIGLNYKNKGELQRAKIYLEKELEILDIMEEKTREGEMFTYHYSSLSLKYAKSFGCLARTHEALGNFEAARRYEEMEELAEKGELAKSQVSKDVFDFWDDLGNAVGENGAISNGENVNDTKKEIRDSENDSFENSEDKNSDKNDLAEEKVVLKHKSRLLSVKDSEEETKPSEDDLQSNKDVVKEAKELHESLQWMLSKTAKNLPSEIEPMYRFKAESFDPILFVSELNLQFLETKNFRKTAQELYRFWRLYLEGLGKC